MKNSAKHLPGWGLFLLLAAISLGCGQRAAEHGDHHEESTANEGNQALYEKVMAVHDEVMPKMNDLYKLKETLQNKIAESPGMAEGDKDAIEKTIVELDSASEGMMVWMRQFDPLPDSLGEDRAREYLENEMEKVQQVRSRIYEALSRADSIQSH